MSDKKEKKKKKARTFEKIYLRCRLLAIAIVMVSLGVTFGILKTIINTSAMTREKAMLTYIICLGITVLTFVIWVVGMNKALKDLVLVHTATGHPRVLGGESVGGFVEYAKISMFTGEQVIGRAKIMWHPKIFRLFLSRIISKQFRNYVDNNRELQIKYYDEKEYNSARKMEVNNTIEDLCVDVGAWEMMSVIYLLLAGISVFFLIINIMG